jgi:hypothetical protein
MIRVECKCKTCKANAATLGRDVLAAEVPAALLANVKKPHGIVWQTNQPGTMGKVFRQSAGTKIA